MKVQKNKSLKNNNTFGLEVMALWYAEPETNAQLIDLLEDPSFFDIPKLVTGSGSNLLYSGDFKGLVIKPSMREISIVSVDDNHVYLRAGAGIDWDVFVTYCADRGWGGVENLSLIPGCVGASPVQNIGAYGCEAGDSVFSVEFVRTDDKRISTFYSEECDFGYRSSVFKTKLKEKAIITYVTFKLSLHPELNLSYAGLSAIMDSYDSPTVRDVRREVISVRKSKLPDPTQLGNAGSFFKNPVVESNIALDLQGRYPEIKIFPVGDDSRLYKISAAWLIDMCGFKGFRFKNAGVHSGHALVLVAYKGAKGDDIIELSQKIKRSVKDRFGIEIMPEVNIITSS